MPRMRNTDATHRHNETELTYLRRRRFLVIRITITSFEGNANIVARCDLLSRSKITRSQEIGSFVFACEKNSVYYMADHDLL